MDAHAEERHDAGHTAGHHHRHVRAGGLTDSHHPDHVHSHDGAGLRQRLRHALVPHSHDHNEAIRSAEETSDIGTRAAWVSLAGMGATALLQIVIVALSGSVALLADTLHNLGHLATTLPLVIAFRLGRRAPTRGYPYGYRRAEDLVGLVIGAVIAASAVLIVWESVRALTTVRDMTHLGWVLAAALVGAAGNEVVARYRIRAGRRIGSAALVAEGQHARTDALTSLAVVLGVVGAWGGAPWLDPVIGLVIAAVVVAVLVSTMRIVVRRLMDGVEPATVELVESTVAQVPGVVSVDRARARWAGHRLEVDVAVTVGPGLTLTAAHSVADAVRKRLRTQVPHLESAAVEMSPAASAR